MRLRTDVAIIQTGIIDNFLQMSRTVVIIIFQLINIYYISWKLSSILISCFCPFFLFIFIYVKKMQNADRLLSSAKYNYLLKIIS